MTTQIETREREIVVVEDARIRPMMGLDIHEDCRPRSSHTRRWIRSSPFTRASFPSVRSGRAWIPSTRTVASTTGGTCSRAQPPPAIAPVQVVRWSVRGCRRDQTSP